MKETQDEVVKANLQKDIDKKNEEIRIARDEGF